MIIGGTFEMKIGSVVRLIVESTDEIQPFFIIREATREEWLQEPRIKELSVEQLSRASYYYEVSSD